MTNSVIILVGFVLSLSRVLIATALRLLYQHDGARSAKNFLGASEIQTQLLIDLWPCIREP